MEKSSIILIIFVIFFIICLLIELLAVDSLQKSSSDYIYSLQKDWSEGSKTFLVIIAYGSLYITVGFGFFYYLISKSKRSIICIYVIFTSVWLGDILKMIIAHPRPFWFDSRIEALKCGEDYGSPSGHAVVVGTLMFFAFFIACEKRKYISILIAVLLFGLLALDRNYLGVHFYFQVVFGYSLAAVLAYGSLHKNMLVILKKVSREFKSFFAFSVLIIALLLLGVLIYFLRNPEMKDEWISNYRDNCSGQLDSESALFFSLSESSGVMIIEGFNAGLYFNKIETVKRWKYIIASVIVFAIGAAIEQVCEMFIMKLNRAGCFVLLCFMRFIIGFYTSFVVPLILSLCFKVST